MMLLQTEKNAIKQSRTCTAVFKLLSQALTPRRSQLSARLLANQVTLEALKVARLLSKRHRCPIPPCRLVFPSAWHRSDGTEQRRFQQIAFLMLCIHYICLWIRRSSSTCDLRLVGATYGVPLFNATRSLYHWEQFEFLGMVQFYRRMEEMKFCVYRQTTECLLQCINDLNTPRYLFETSLCMSLSSILPPQLEIAPSLSIKPIHCYFTNLLLVVKTCQLIEDVLTRE